MTTLFWTTLEQIPGRATDTREWQDWLGANWSFARRYLKRTGQQVRRMKCPYSGGEHCPRTVVQHSDGSVRAVCSDPAGLCDALDLSIEDIRIRELDVPLLLADIATALSVTPTPDRKAEPRLLHLGDHMIAAGRGVPVFASLAALRDPLTATDVLDLDRHHLPFVLLAT
ncbi:MAG: hypothetical protein AAFQ17_08125, partial [Pseudomonadota bacterium]